ncbi:MAG: DUF1801 domain-containing protein [Burkholderiaceae bacterium]
MSGRKKSAAAADTTAAVDAFMAALEHPFKAEVQALREIIVGADPMIAEGIKWNAPSFRTHEYFLTTHLRAKGGVGLIFHLGARPREQQYITVDDPTGLLHWLARDRAVALFTGPDDVAARRPALEALLRAWIAQIQRA